MNNFTSLFEIFIEWLQTQSLKIAALKVGDSDSELNLTSNSELILNSRLKGSNILNIHAKPVVTKDSPNFPTATLLWGNNCGKKLQLVKPEFQAKEYDTYKDAVEINTRHFNLTSETQGIALGISYNDVPHGFLIQFCKGVGEKKYDSFWTFVPKSQVITDGRSLEGIRMAPAMWSIPNVTSQNGTYKFSNLISQYQSVFFKALKGGEEGELVIFGHPENERSVVKSSGAIEYVYIRNDLVWIGSIYMI